MTTITILTGQHLELVQGDDYLLADSRALTWRGVGVTWPAALTSVTLRIAEPSHVCLPVAPTPLELPGVYTAATVNSPAIVTVNLARINTLALQPGVRRYTYSLRGVLLSTAVLTLAHGHITILPL